MRRPTADALPRSYELELASLRATLCLGPPARMTLRGLAGRTQRNPQDVIIRL